MGGFNKTRMEIIRIVQAELGGQGVIDRVEEGKGAHLKLYLTVRNQKVVKVFTRSRLHPKAVRDDIRKEVRK